jgi:hypothetical protein
MRPAPIAMSTSVEGSGTAVMATTFLLDEPQRVNSHASVAMSGS